VVLDEDLCYRALESRDPRFDGRFFTGVVTTGVYCRPICPARTPLRRNMRFFPCAAAAEAAGFRPCRRCRPESAPGSPPWNGAASTVSRALRLIEDGALDRAGGPELAAQLGVGDRYLRRLFERHLGTSPRSVASSRRAHFARALLDATALPMTEVALASGFRSVRQFNQVMRAVFDRPPGELRRRGPAARAPSGGAVRLRLAFRPPLAWRPLLAFLASRAIRGVEEVELGPAESGPGAGRYRRTFAGPDGPGLLEVSMAPDGRALDLAVRGPGGAGRPSGLLDVSRRARRLFDLDADPLAIADRLGSSRLLAPALAAHPGLRVPGAWDPFEVLVRAILGQQITVAAATTLAGRLVERCGAPVPPPSATSPATAIAASPAPPAGLALSRLFPTPAAIAAADLSAIGLTSARAAALRQVAAAAATDPALLGPAAGLDELVDRLCRLPGVGPWTAHYLAMRAMREPDAFPSGDLVLRRAAGGLSARALADLSDEWRPWRAYAAIALWTTSAAPAAQREEDRHAHRARARRITPRTDRDRAGPRPAVRPRVRRF
jgi:AraC family transcriptional regulator of adaptative response / DNA-3-methyladenine glycosylase II